MLEHWLFVENVSYKEAIERAQKEWGVTGSTVSLGRFYQRLEKERVVGEMEAAVETATEVDAAQGKLAGLKSSAMKVMGMRLLQKAVSEGEVKELAMLSRALSQCEEREIQRRRLELARQKFEFNAVKAALKRMSLLEKISQEDQEREDARIDAVRLEIFGTPPTDINHEC